MDSFKKEFLHSCLSEKNPYQSTEEIILQLTEMIRYDSSKIIEIPFNKLKKWYFEGGTGNLVHDSGKFFSIEGLHVRTNSGAVSEWEQPIINQPEIGILGILTKKIDGILYFLMQAKIEPGNINTYQLAPTVQATKSNYTRVHQGNRTDYLQYFMSNSNSRVMLDVLQSEQGARFLRKRNRNIIVQTDEEVPLKPNFFWLTLGQINKLLEHDNMINMDARSVISCIHYCDRRERSMKSLYETINSFILHNDIKPNRLSEGIIKSLLSADSGINSIENIIAWFTRQKVKYDLELERRPLNSIEGWVNDEWKIQHMLRKYFSVVAVDVEIAGREISSWTQPIIKPYESGIVAFITKEIDGTMHFLVQAKVEPGNFDIVEMAPTVQCITGSYKEDSPEKRPLFLDYVLSAGKDRIIDTMQSEEGGRFFKEENHNIIVEAGDDFDIKVPDNYIWLTLGQIKEFIKYNNFVNVEARCLSSSISLI